MSRIETQLAIHAPPDRVFEEITHPENIPLFAPGIDEAHTRGASAPDAATNMLDLVTRSGRHMNGRIVEEAENEEVVIEDENGTVVRWGLQETEEGTMATFVLEGEFDPETERELRSEMRAKIARLVLDLERER
jgi:uncharacterized protein YndB with AHSA1/START domain